MSLSPTTREIKAAQSRDNLCKATIMLLQEYGIERVTVDDICSHCGVTKGAFYHHFISKDHIIFYAVNHEMDKYIEKNFQPQPALPVHEQLLTLQKLSFTSFRQLGKAMTRYACEGQVRSQIDLQQPDRCYVRYLSDIVTQGIEKKEFRTQLNFDNCYMMNLSIYGGFLIRWSSVPDEQDQRYQWDRILEELIASLFV